MRGTGILVLLAVLVVSLGATSVSAGGATRVPAAIWAHGELYDTVVTPTSFVAPPEHSTDAIYSFMMSGLGGQRSVADSAPGDPDFNGGRWNVQVVTFTDQGRLVHDQNGDGLVDVELASEEAVLEQEYLGNVVITPASFYFECPMLPRKGR